MKIKKAVKLYSIVVPRQQQDQSFFQANGVDTLYFKSRQEAELYQQAHYPDLQVTSSDLLAVEDKDKEGRDRWVTIREVEEFNDPVRNKCHGSYTPVDTYTYAVSPALEQAIRTNPSSVIAVIDIKTDIKENSGAYGGPDHITITYDGVDSGAAATRFLYVEGFKRTFVERGQEVNVIDASQLVKQHQIRELQLLQEQLAAEQARLESELNAERPSVRP